MARDGGKMTYSRVKKYQELRDGLKEEVGISKEKYVEPVQNDGDDDDFLSFMKKDKEEKEVNLEDTLTETKTFEQMREEGSAELDKALKSAKESVGKQDQYNTRMDILSKITNNEIYKSILYKTIQNIVKGDKISDAFKDHWAIPDVAYYMIVTGESTGELAEMMQKVSDYYQGLHKNMINSLKAFIEPIMIAFLAVVVGGIIIAVIIPMFNLYGTIQNS